MTKKFFKGWKKDTSDNRDLIFNHQLGATAPVVLPSSVDLRTTGFLSPVYDQGQLGSCTANALAAMFQFIDRKQSGQTFAPSRLFIYYNERDMEGTVAQDDGAQIRDGIKSIVGQGVCLENEWPYDIGQFTQKPTPQCYTDALKHEATVYRRILPDLQDMKACLAHGYPFVAGIQVFSSFETDDTAKTGVIPMPLPTDECEGGHAVMCVGYDDVRQCFIFQNSWGDQWGDHGFFYLPYDYLTNPDLASDFWTVSVVEV